MRCRSNDKQFERTRRPVIPRHTSKLEFLFQSRLQSLAPLNYAFNSFGISSSNSSNASRRQRFTSFKLCPPVICFVPAKICLPEEETIRRYPHQLPLRPADHWRKALLYVELVRSQVLKAAGTKYCSAIFLMSGCAKIAAPASLHPRHPDHSTKFTKMGFPVSEAAWRAASKSPCLPSAVRLQ